MAAKRNREEDIRTTIAELRKETIDEFLTNNTKGINELLPEGYCIVVEAVRGGKEVVELCVEHEADVNVVDKDKISALHFAVLLKQKDTVEYLISKGANVNAQNKFGTTPLLIAVSNKLNELVDILLNAGADVKISNNDGYNVLHYCDADRVEEFIKKGADPNKVSTSGQLPTTSQVHRSNYPAFKKLTEFGGSVDLSLEEILRIACRLAGSEFIINLPGTEDIIKEKGEEMVKAALFLSNAKTTRALVEKGAPVTTCLTALVVARLCHHLFGLFIEKGADVNHYDGFNTPLHDAALMDDVDIAILVLKQRPDLSILNREGMTPLEYARKQSPGRVSYVIRKYIEDPEAFMKVK